MSGLESSPPLLIAPRAELNYFHEAQCAIPAHMTAFAAYQQMTQDPPAWLKHSFKIRDMISTRFGGIQAIQGFSEDQRNTLPQVGEKLDFFDVVKMSDTELYLQAPDRHLCVQIALQIESNTQSSAQLKMTTSVVTYNRFGQLYMLPVAPMHGVIIHGMMKKLALK